VNRSSKTFRIRITIKLRQPHGRGRRLGIARDDEAGDALGDDSGYRAVAHGHYRGPASHRLDHRHPKRFAPCNWKQQTGGGAQEFGLLMFGDLTDELDMRLREERFDSCLKYA